MVKKRQEIYHCDFVVNGVRYRESLHTGDWREARHREAEMKSRAIEGKLASGQTAAFSRLLFCAAVEKYLAELSIQRHTGSAWEKALLVAPCKFFEAKHLHQITAEDIRAFQGHRLSQGLHNNTINQETKSVMRLLRRGKLLSRLRDDIKLLPARKEPRRVLVESEKQRLFETASQRPDWQIAYCAALLTANTSMRPIELKRLAWNDLDPFNRLVSVGKSKTDAGTRVIPLNDLAWSAFAALKQRADIEGLYAPEWHIFCRRWPQNDPARPMGSWRKAWRNLRKAAAQGDPERELEPMPNLKKFRYYDLRHQCITEMLENGTPDAVVREVVGHIDPAVIRVYSHPRLLARRQAVEGLVTVKMGVSEGSCGTINGTKALPAADESLQVAENITKQ